MQQKKQRGLMKAAAVSASLALAGAASAATVSWDGGPSGDWHGGYYEYITEGSGDTLTYKQKYVRKILAQIFDRDGDGTPYVDQWTDTHLTLKRTGGDALNSSAASPQSIPLA